DILWRRGLVHHRKSDFERALADFDEAIRLAPRECWFFRSRGHTHKSAGMLDCAIADYTEAIRLYFNMIGDALWVEITEPHATENAIAEFVETDACELDLAEFLVDRGNALFAKGELARARADYRNALLLHVNNPLILTNNGVAPELVRELTDGGGVVE